MLEACVCQRPHGSVESCHGEMLEKIHLLQRIMIRLCGASPAAVGFLLGDFPLSHALERIIMLFLLLENMSDRPRLTSELIEVLKEATNSF